MMKILYARKSISEEKENFRKRGSLQKEVWHERMLREVSCEMKPKVSSRNLHSSAWDMLNC